MGFLDSLKKMLMGDNKTTTDQPSTNLDTPVTEPVTPEAPEVSSPEVSSDTSDSGSN